MFTLIRSLFGRSAAAVTMPAAPAHPRKKTFPIMTGDGRSMRQLIDVGKYHWVCAVFQLNVDQGKISASPYVEEIEIELFELKRRKLEIRDVPDALDRELAARGLERPTAEDALRFGEKYFETNWFYNIIFLSEAKEERIALSRSQGEDEVWPWIMAFLSDEPMSFAGRRIVKKH